jgi:hypothetical protein
MSSTLEPKARYALTMLALSPHLDAERILQIRAKALGQAVPSAAAPRPTADLKQQRARAQAEIDLLRRQFWTTIPENLRQRIAAIDVKDLPELRPAVERLGAVVELQKEFARLQKHPQRQINLFNTLKRIVTLTAREAGAVKESYLRTAVKSESLADVKRMIGMLQQEFPMIYRLESNWLDEIRSLKPRRARRESDVEFELPIPLWAILAVIIFILRALAYAFFK